MTSGVLPAQALRQLIEIGALAASPGDTVTFDRVTPAALAAACRVALVAGELSAPLRQALVAARALA